jgi:hypothetical protein
MILRSSQRRYLEVGTVLDLNFNPAPFFSIPIISPLPHFFIHEYCMPRSAAARCALSSTLCSRLQAGRWPNKKIKIFVGRWIHDMRICP